MSKEGDFALEMTLLGYEPQERAERVVEILGAIRNASMEVADRRVVIDTPEGTRETTVAAEAQRVGSELTSSVNETI